LQEPRGRSNQHVRAREPSFAESWARFAAGGDAVRRLAAIGLGAVAFSMEDVLLEPYGGQVLGLAVGDTTKLTATLAVGGLIGFTLASVVLSRGFEPFRMAAIGAVAGVAGFSAVIAAGPAGSTLLSPRGRRSSVSAPVCSGTAP
jgi:BCD family chlorophyll transporter-like MFS transporter